jgi:hypothetical protein
LCWLNNKKTILILSIILLLSIICTLGYRKINAIEREMKLILTVQHLKDIALSSLVYQNEFDCFPVDAKLLKIKKGSLADPATNRAFILLFSKHEEKFDERILAKQALPVSISLFPWGEKKRYAAFADGTVRNIEK